MTLHHYFVQNEMSSIPAPFRSYNPKSVDTPS